MQAKRSRWLAGCALVAYCALIVKFIVFKDIPVIRIGHVRYRLGGTRTGPGNFVPLRSIGSLFRHRGNHLMNMVNLFGNILPFMPVGFLAPFVFRSFTWPKALALGVLTGLSCEVLEVIFRVGIFDVDDIAMNAFGVLLGYGVYRMFHGQPQGRRRMSAR